MELDGQPAALDVTMFTTNVLSPGSARAARVKDAIVARLLDLPGESDLLAAVSFDPAAIMKPKPTALAGEIRRLADAYEAALRSLGDADEVDVTGMPLWVRRARLKVRPDRAGPRKVTFFTNRPRPDPAGEVDLFIAECVRRKGGQMTAWGSGILVISHGLHETADDLRAGFERLEACPWWRVYWAGAAPELVEVVATGHV